MCRNAGCSIPQGRGEEEKIRISRLPGIRIVFSARITFILYQGLEAISLAAVSVGSEDAGQALRYSKNRNCKHKKGEEQLQQECYSQKFKGGRKR